MTERTNLPWNAGLSAATYSKFYYPNYILNITYSYFQYSIKSVLHIIITELNATVSIFSNVYESVTSP